VSPRGPARRLSAGGTAWRSAASLSTVALATLLGVSVASCGGDSVEPGPDGASPACAALLYRLPATVLDRPRGSLDVAGAAAWGDPAIVLRCGIAAGGPTSNPCLEADGLDWTFSQASDTLLFTSFGRSPAIEVRVPLSVGRETASGALIDLAPAVRPIPATRRCT
jgi:Protein of unknown function (DUF3515)